MNKLVVGLVGGLAALASAVAEPVKVVSFSPLLSEIASAVGGDAVKVVTLVRPGADPHGYEPSPGDMKEAADARVILVSGKGLERWLGSLDSTKAIVLAVGDKLPSLKLEHEDESRHHEEDEHHHDHGEVDPHWWHSVPQVELATKVVRDALIEAVPADRVQFEKNAAAYLASLAKLDLWVKRRVSELPRDRRELVTSHDAFQYFAKQYGFHIRAIEGLSPEQEASAREVSALIAVIKERGVKAVFLEDGVNPKASREITQETGARIGGSLAADGLGTGDSATYEGMMKHNVTTIVEALK
jgi:zinc/manganese transport system substrate-binding protein